MKRILDHNIYFDTATDYVLENDRVLMRPLQYNDLTNLETFSINEPRIWSYSLTSAAGIENMKQYISTAIEGRVAGVDYPFIVFDKKQERYAGSTRFYDIQKYHKTTQLGYTWYGSDFQGTGLNKNCKFLMLEFAFEKMHVERVEFRADNRNERSIAAMKSIGAIQEGVLRSNCKGILDRRDSIILSILKEDWFEGVKTSLQQRIV